MKYIVFDIDGVLADCSHRLKYIKGEKKDYDKFYSDEEVSKDDPIYNGVSIFQPLQITLSEMTDVGIVVLTGRSKACAKPTCEWLDKYVNFYQDDQIFMRPSNDWRPAHEVKEDLIKKYIGFENILFAFDDDDKINEMYAKHGVMCYKPNITRSE